VTEVGDQGGGSHGPLKFQKCPPGGKFGLPIKELLE